MTTPQVAPAATAADETIVWTETLRVGVPEIDADHRVLIDLIAQISLAIGEHEAYSVIGTVLAALLDYTEYHFAREERMLAAIGYAELEGHHRIHQALKQQVADYLRRYNADSEALDMGELFTFLRHWLIDHIMEEDMRYASSCANNPQAREAAASLGREFFIDPDMDSF